MKTKLILTLTLAGLIVLAGYVWRDFISSANGRR